MRKFMTMLTVALLSFGVVSAQTRIVSGKVTNSKGEAVPAATVKKSKGGTTVVTDENGNFQIQAQNGDVLVVTSVNYSSEKITVAAGKDKYAVSLAERVNTMEELVVTAGGIKSKRKELGTASTVVSAQALVTGKATNVANGLQGKVAGFQISGTGGGVNPTYRLTLRGQRSITGNNQALVVLDNVVVPSSILGNLNPEDIESVNVLNGAGAAALYGSQASNGALIVTTKKGKRGVTLVNVSNTTTIEQVAFFPKIQKEFGAGGTAYGLDENGNPYPQYLENQSYGARFDGTLQPLGPPLEDGTQDSALYQYNDGHFKFWEKGITNQTDFSLTTGDEKSTIYFSGQYATVTGTTPGDKYNRANLRVNGTRKIGEKVLVTYSTGYTQNRYNITTQTGSMYGNMLNMPSNVDITRYKNWRTDKFANPNGYYNPWYQNPYFTADNYRASQRNDYLVGSVEIKFTPIAGLDLIARQGITTRNYSNKNTVGAFDYTDYAEHTDASGKVDIPASVSDGSFYQTQLLTDAFAQYTKRINDDFTFNAIVGGQWTQNQSKYLGMAANGLVIPDLFNVSNGVGTPSVSESNYKARQIGAYGDIRLGYKGFLFLHGTGRNDWVSILNPENRSFFYPSVDLSFVASDAISAVKSSKLISYLQFRGGWSKVGQVNLVTGNDYGAYALLPIFTGANGFPFGSLAGYTVGNQLVSNSLKPEITKGFEAGFDLNLLGDRFTSKFTYYNSKTDNQTANAPVSSSTGFTNLLTNIGKTQSKGIEAVAHYTPIKTRNWNVTVGGNYTYLDNSVLSIREDVGKIGLSANGSGASYALAGYAFPVIMGFDYKRDPQGRVIVDHITGLPTKQSSISVLGNAQARHRLGLDGTAQYKNLRLSVLFEYRGGYKIFNSMGPEMDWSGTGIRTAAYDRQSFVYPNSVYEDPNKPGTYVANTSVAIANGNGNNGFWTDGINRDVTSNYVTSGDFWKLREVALSYEIPARVLGGKVFKGITVSIQGRNLFMWMAKDNLYTDPEYSTAGTDNNGIGITGLDSAPPSRFYGATVSFKF